jgi:hypothetical protein
MACWVATNGDWQIWITAPLFSRVKDVTVRFDFTVARLKRWWLNDQTSSASDVAKEKTGASIYVANAVMVAVDQNELHGECKYS